MSDTHHVVRSLGCLTVAIALDLRYRFGIAEEIAYAVLFLASGE